MKTQAFTLIIAVILSLSAKSEIIERSSTVYFDTDKYILTEETKTTLNIFLKNIDNNDDYEITVYGHTDDVGSINYNANLSQNRANAVRQYLIEHGINRNNVKIDYFGELKPFKPNINDKCRDLNRRVELKLTKYVFKNIEDLQQSLIENKNPSYIISPNESNLIKGNQGVKILIEPNSFIYPDGSIVDEDVKVELVEALNIKDFVANDLATICDNKILESGGMIKITAQTVSGKEVVVNNTEDLTIAVPTKNRKDNMEVFSSNSGSDWVATNQKINLRFDPLIPPKPRRFTSKIYLPKYKVDMSNKPKEVAVPHEPREPYYPEKERYIRPVKWYQFLYAGKLKKKQEHLYEQVLKRYDRKYDKYLVRLEKYNKAIKDYPTKLSNYYTKLKEWEEQVEIDRKNFYESMGYKEAYEKRLREQIAAQEAYELALEKWKEIARIKIEEAAIKMEKLGVADQQVMDNYLFAYTDLDWINIDRFYHMSEFDKRPIAVLDNDTTIEKVYIIFKDMQCILPMYKSNDRYVQPSFPKSELASIFAYKVEDGKAMVYYQDITAENNYEMEFTQKKFAEIKEILSQFNDSNKQTSDL